MLDQDRPKFALLVNALAANFGKQADEPMLEGYWRALRDMPIASVERAVDSALQQCRYMPRGVELRELGGEMPIAARAVLAWDAVRRALALHGGYASVNFDDPIVNATIRNLGGWQRITALDTEETDKWTRKEFERIYGSLCSSGVTEEQAAHLVGIHEQNNAPLGIEPRITAVVTGLPPHREGIVRQIGTGKQQALPTLVRELVAKVGA